MFFWDRTGSNRLNVFGTRYRGSAKDLGLCSPYGVPPHPLPAHSIPRLCRWEARPAADPELDCSRRTPFPPCALRFTTAQIAAGVDTGFGRRVSNGLPIQRLASFWPTGAPLDPAPYGSKLEDFGRLRASGWRSLSAGMPPLTGHPQTGLLVCGISPRPGGTSPFRGRQEITCAR